MDHPEITLDYRNDSCDAGSVTAGCGATVRGAASAMRRSAPSLEVLRELYRGIKSLSNGNVVRMSHEDIARTLDLDMADGSTVGAAIRIFNEGGLVETGIDEDGRFVRFLDATQKVDLTKTTRYAEGLAEREGFEKFCGLALVADAPTLEQIVNRPIYPDRVPLEA